MVCWRSMSLVRGISMSFLSQYISSPVLVSLTLYKRFKCHRLESSPLIANLYRHGVIYLLCITGESCRLLSGTQPYFLQWLRWRIALQLLRFLWAICLESSGEFLIRFNSHHIPHFLSGKVYCLTPYLKLSRRSPQVVVHSVLASRILFNLRALQEPQDVTISRPVVSSRVVFGPNQYSALELPEIENM